MWCCSFFIFSLFLRPLKKSLLQILFLRVAVMK